MEVFQGTISSPASTGSQAVTGLGFRPKCLMIMSTNDTAENSETNAGLANMFGASDGSTTFSISNRIEGTAFPVRADSRQTNAVIISILNAAGSVTHVATFTSFDTDGFTINWTTAGTSGTKFYYIAMGGGDLSGFKIVTVDSPTSTGAQVVTGVGFSPSSIMHFSSIVDASTAVATAAFARLSIGFVSQDSAKACHSVYYSDNTAGSSDASRIINNDDFCKVVGASDATAMQASLTSFDTDGFTINWAAVLGTSKRFYALCFNGLQSRAGTLLQKASAGVQNYTGLTNYTPKLGFIFGTSEFDENSLAHYCTSFSAVSGSSTQKLFAGLGLETGSAGAGNMTKTMRSDACTWTTTFPSADDASFNGFLSDGISLNWVGAGSGQRVYGYMLFGSGAGSNGMLLGVW